MPSPSKPPVPRAAEPKYGPSFDPWNSSATGHQRAENRLGGSTGWRDSRNTKLMSQYKGGAGGGKRVSDTVGAGSEHWDPKLKALVPPELRARAESSVSDMLANPGLMRRQSSVAGHPSRTEEQYRKQGSRATEETFVHQRRAEDEPKDPGKGQKVSRIFDGVVAYVNGSTYPLISDHKLKHVLAEHGGKMSSHLGRRQVTHVIIGRPAGKGGAGGGLAGGKLQKEITKVGGRGVKFVGVQWVLESIRNGKRLPESRFSDLKIASKSQQSVSGLYSCPKTDDDDGTELRPGHRAR
ncbi:hypothetical protein F5Y15DRAFT_3556 [Xylariaceae sp. FL0016]|nr:hypothetical protein F5Y15DRAFT_3556 [Xylariaceae sp. FL0016]